MPSQIASALCGVILLLGALYPIHAQQPTTKVTRVHNGFTLTQGERMTTLTFVADDVVRVTHTLLNQPDSDTAVLASPLISPTVRVTSRNDGESLTLSTKGMTVRATLSDLSVTVLDIKGQALLSEASPFASWEELAFAFDGSNLYGIRSYSTADFAGDGLLRNQGGVVEAGYQGQSGAPLIYTTRFGLLVDSVGGEFKASDTTIRFADRSTAAKDVFVIAGDPATVMQHIATISGLSPMRPKWSLGFIHSEWGNDEAEVREMVATYQAKDVPLDAVALDFDYKAWGEDNSGEFRWNSTNGPGNVHPNKFPNGASGAFGDDMLKQGVRLIGIMKPRIILQTPSGAATTQAQAVDALGCWYPDQKPYIEYFSQRLARDVDFSKPECRDWYWSQSKQLFDAGIAGWWNDEADIGENRFRFDDLQGLNMGRAMHDGQRAVSDQRVFQLNRNFYLGAQRYVYGLWSGDTEPSWSALADQRARMLSSINVGAAQWGMDVGGFLGTPSPELYARWMQFGAVVPIFRVHGSQNEQRQPWAFGEKAEKVATEAIRLRHALMPYLYSLERVASETGIGLVRPLMQAFPDDPNVANAVDSWMLGDGLLVSPVVERGQREKVIYLPSGVWTDFATGQTYAGPGLITHTVDAENWSDLPMFVRAGAILPMQPTTPSLPTSTVAVNVFPGNGMSSFSYYDDDGLTYAYERSEYFKQAITATQTAREARLTLGRPEGTFAAPASYLFHVHGREAKRVVVNGRALQRFDSLDALLASGQMGWAMGEGEDRFGRVTHVKTAANRATTLSVVGTMTQREAIAARPIVAPQSQFAPASYCPDAGGATLSYWNDIGPDKRVRSLTERSDFPEAPSVITQTRTLQVGYTNGRNYGARVEGYICPPYTGEYTFWLASDDQSQVFLSSDDQPVNKREIARVDEWAYVGEWDKYPSQRSALISLEAGKRYYVELLHKADGTEDHAEVAWQGPGLTRRVVAEHFLTPMRAPTPQAP